MITTLGFSVRAELAHHCQRQPPYICLSGYFSYNSPRLKHIVLLKKESWKVQSTFLDFSPNILGMKYETLDYFFPFFVFFYGILMTSVLESQFLQKVAGQRFSATGLASFATLRSHKGLAWACLFVGGLWTLQNLWFESH